MTYEPDTGAGYGQGPLTGVRVVEFAGLGPVPFAGMLLSDMGAEVVRIERPGVSALDPTDITARGRRFVNVDMKSPAGLAQARSLVEHAEVLLEGFRPGVMERLGVGPTAMHALNPALVYARMTGWGQTGPLAASVGHDINYIAITGALAAIGPGERPMAPLNLVGDYGGGALYLMSGVLAALISARATGRGQVVDCAMVDGVISLMSLFQGLRNAGRWQTGRERNLLDGGAHFYATYRCQDGGYLAVGAIEPQFYAALRRLMALDDPVFDAQLDQTCWPAARERLSAIFATRTRAQWCALLEGTDACVSPVLSMDEAMHHPHLAARATPAQVDGCLQAMPAPRFDRTPSRIQGPPAHAPSVIDDIVHAWAASAPVGDRR